MPTRLKAADYLTNRQTFLHGAQQVQVEGCADTVAVGYVKIYGQSGPAGYVVFFGKQSKPSHHYSAPNAEQARLRVETILREAGAMAQRHAERKKQVRAEFEDSVKEGITTRRYSVAATAKAIRQTLKDTFAGHKFSVTTDAGSLRVRWSNGPLRRQVEALLKPYEAGHFDGMQDMYVYAEGRAHITSQGVLVNERWGAKYVSCQRDTDEVQRQLEAAEIAWLAEMGE